MNQDEEESAGDRTGGSGMVEPNRVLGEASVILRDPSAMHLLAATALQVRLWMKEGVVHHTFTAAANEHIAFSFVLSLSLFVSVYCLSYMQMVQEGAMKGKLPREHRELSFVLSLMQLAVEGRTMLKDRVYK